MISVFENSTGELISVNDGISEPSRIMSESERMNENKKTGREFERVMNEYQRILEME